MTIDIDGIKKMTEKGKRTAAKREAERVDRQHQDEQREIKRYIVKNKPKVKEEIEKGIQKEAKRGQTSFYISSSNESDLPLYKSLLYAISYEMTGFTFNIGIHDGGYEGPSFVSCTVSW